MIVFGVDRDNRMNGVSVCLCLCLVPSLSLCLSLSVRLSVRLYIIRTPPSNVQQPWPCELSKQTNKNEFHNQKDKRHIKNTQLQIEIIDTSRQENVVSFSFCSLSLSLSLSLSFPFKRVTSLSLSLSLSLFPVDIHDLLLTSNKQSTPSEKKEKNSFLQFNSSLNSSSLYIIHTRERQKRKQ